MIHGLRWNRGVALTCLALACLVPRAARAQGAEADELEVVVVASDPVFTSCGSLQLISDDAPTSGDKPAEDPLAALPADAQTKLRTFIEKLNKAKMILFDRQMKEVTDAVVKATGLSDENQLKELAAAARDAEEHSLAEWTMSFKKMIQKGYQQDPQDVAASVDMMAGMVDMMAAQGDAEFKHKPPEEQPAWTQALARVLNPAQFAAWNQARDKDDHKEDKDTARFLDTQTDRIREQYSASMQTESAEIAAALDLPKERAAKLDTLAKSAVDATVKAFRKTTARMIASMDEEQRGRMLKEQNVYYGVQDDDAPTKQEVWKLGLEKLLGDADRQRLGQLEEERKTRRARAMGTVLLALLDERVALTTGQRDRLADAAARAAEEETTLFPTNDGGQGYYTFQRETFLKAAGRMKEGDVKPVLDAAQWPHWQEACKAADGRDNPQTRRRGRATPDTPSATQKVENLEPEEYERAISDCLEEKAADERRRQLAVMNLRAEDAARVAGLGEPAVGSLRTAARGTVEESLTAWKANLAQNVRSQVDNAGPENVRALLANLPDYQFRRNDSSEDGDKKGLWERTVAVALTGEQRAAWEQEVKARSAYREKAIAGIILAEFNRRHRITVAQEAKLTTLVVTAIRDYSPDIARMFSYSFEYAPWYLQNYTMFLPLACVPENDLKEALGKEGWDRWSGSPEFANSNNYWQNLKRYHEQRTKESKK